MKIKTLAEVEKQQIAYALYRFGDDKANAAKALGICRATIYRKIKDYGLNDENKFKADPNPHADDSVSPTDSCEHSDSDLQAGHTKNINLNE